MKYLWWFPRKRLFSCITKRRFSCKPLLKEELTDAKFDSFLLRSRLDQLCPLRDGLSLTPNILNILNLKRKRDECISAINDLSTFNAPEEMIGKLENDKEFYELARLELDELREQKISLECSILEMYLLEEDQNDVDNRGGLILSAMTGAGGQESMLFAKELFTMYNNYCRFKCWDFEVLELGESDLGGYHFASAQITGVDAYKCLRFEAGIHRVQRVPTTEKSGRIHTSTASITICPVPKSINSNLDFKDIRKETYKAGGHGGQHLQKTETAVRLTHLPTKIFVECQQERSQNANLELAMKRLAAKLYERQYAREVDKSEKSRKLQMGSRDRSEKIRTYNFLEQRVSDHRIKRNFHPVNDIMNGAEAFNEIVDALMEFNMKERLMELINSDIDTK